MSLIAHLEKNDSESKAYYALVGACVVTGVIALVWFSTLPARLGSKVSLDKSVQDTVPMKEESIGGFIQNAKSELGNLISASKKGIPDESEDVGNISQETESVETPSDTLGELGHEDGNSTVGVTTSVPYTEEVSYESEPGVVSDVASTTPVVIEQQPTPPRTILIGTTSTQITE